MGFYQWLLDSDGIPNQSSFQKTLVQSTVVRLLSICMISAVWKAAGKLYQIRQLYYKPSVNSTAEIVKQEYWGQIIYQDKLFGKQLYKKLSTYLL